MSNINKKRLINLFCELVKIKSPSGKEEEIAQKVSQLLSECGLMVEKDDYGNIIAKLDGAGETLIFCAHLDTVAVDEKVNIKPIIKDGIVTSDGTTILGADNKDAIAAILEALRVLQESATSHCPLEIVFTKEEEAISRGAQNLDYSKLSGKFCVIADHAEPYGTIVLGAPGVVKFNIEIIGKRAHVKNPEDGVNSILAAARAISQIPLGKIDEYTAVNVAFQIAGLKGVIDQETKSITTLGMENCNSIPDLCLVFGEVRGIYDKTITETLEKIKFIFEKETQSIGADVVFKTEKLTSGYILDQNDLLINKVAEEFKRQGIEPKFHYAIGGSDANVFNNRGIRTVVVSSAGKNNHQLSEYLVIEELIKLADFFLGLARN